MNVNEIAAYLQTRGYSPAEARVYAAKAAAFSDGLKQAFDEYASAGGKPEFSYGGRTLDDVAKHTYSDLLSAFFYMDKIMKDPEYAKYFGNMQFGRK